MSLVGNLEDLPLADILQIVSLSKRTGILTIETEEGKNIIVFKHGLIISAACPSPKIKNLGQVLLERQLVTSSRLQELLNLQKARGNEPLGLIILQSGIIDRQELSQIIQNQIKATIYHLMSMSEGKFSFDLSEVIPFDDIHYNPMETMLEQGLNPQQLLLDGARISDEERRDENLQEEESEPAPALEIPAVPEFDDVLSYDELNVEPDEASDLSLEDLQLPESSELPDLEFDTFADQIEIPVNVQPPVAITPVPPAEPLKQLILVVDDEALIRQMIARRLIEKGYDVLLADGPADAIRIVNLLIEEKRNPWIISDLVMPTTVGNGFLGGLELVEAVRRLNSSIPIIVINDFDDPKAQTRAYGLGVHQFHKKPNVHKSSMNDFENVLSKFTDDLVEAFRQPPHQIKQSELGEDFWSDLGIESSNDAPNTSATNMMRQMAALHEIIQQLRNPNEAPEISLLILRYAAEFFDRGLLFLVKKDEVNGLGGFGDTGDAESMPVRVRRIKFSLKEDSIFARVVRKKQTHIGKVGDTPVNRMFISMTGRLMPTSIAMLPLTTGNDVIALLYGDNAVTKRPIKDLEALEIFIVQAGMAMENAVLHRKIDTLKFR
jgi:CheY-like chemotaxis protein